MRCGELHDRIDLYLAGTLPADERRSWERHLEQCADCAGIVAALASPPVLDEDLTATVMAQTTGPACAAVQAWMVGDDTDDEAACARHCDTCEECGALRATVRGMDAVLPSLAEMTPDRDFLLDVLQATTLPPASGWERLARRAGDLWAQLTRRPNFSLELSYAVTVLLVIAVSAPGSPLRPVADASLRWLQSDAKAEALPFSVAQNPVAQVAGTVREDLSTRSEQTALACQRTAGHLVLLMDELFERDLQGVGDALGELGCDLRLVWDGMRKQLPEGEPECSDE